MRIFLQLVMLEIHQSVTQAHAAAPTVSILYYPLFVWDVRTMTSWGPCLNCPPPVWLSASFTLAIFSHFANLPSRWDNRKLLKVFWLQMSGADVPLFLQQSCNFIFYRFPALCTFDPCLSACKCPAWQLALPQDEFIKATLFKSDHVKALCTVFI